MAGLVIVDHSLEIAVVKNPYERNATNNQDKAGELADFAV